MFFGQPVLPHVTNDRKTKQRRRRRTRVKQVELLSRRSFPASAALAESPGRLARLAVGDQHRLAVAGVDSGDGVAELEHPGTSTDNGVVCPFRVDAERVAHVGHLEVAGGDAIDVGRSEFCLGHGVSCSVEGQPQGGFVGDGPDVV